MEAGIRYKGVGCDRPISPGQDLINLDEYPELGFVRGYIESMKLLDAQRVSVEDQINTIKGEGEYLRSGWVEAYTVKNKRYQRYRWFDGMNIKRSRNLSPAAYKDYAARLQRGDRIKALEERLDGVMQESQLLRHKMQRLASQF